MFCLSNFLKFFKNFASVHKIENGLVIPIRVHTVVISVQHSEDISNEDMRRILREDVIEKVIPAQYLDKDTMPSFSKKISKNVFINFNIFRK